MRTTTAKAHNQPIFEPLILEMYRYVNRTTDLTDAELEMLRFAATRLNGKETADLGGGEVDVHYRNIMTKLHAKSMKQAVAIAISKGIIE